MKQLWRYALICLLIAGCKSTEQPQDKDEIDSTKFGEVVLSSVDVGDGDENTRANSAKPMATGEQFRLYAFEKGESDINKLVATRTYTIANTAGVPVLDAGQQKLTLPIGEIDIYLVGPLKVDLNAGQKDGDGNPLPANIYDIATADGVYPRNSIDLIASYALLDVQAGVNQFVSPPLQHKMARMDVVVEKPVDATYTNLKVNTIRISNQMMDGEFLFDGKGTIVPVEEGGVSIYPVIKEEISGKRFRTISYMLPREKVHMRIAVYFTCEQPGAGGFVDRRLESGIINDKSLVAGEINQFTTKPHLSNDLEFRYRLLPWVDVNMPEDNLPVGEHQLFSYSGVDEPMVIEGKRYWRDGSGQENHAELIGDIRYNKEERYYYSNSPAAYIRVPSLGNVPVYTFEVTAETAQGNDANIASFGFDGVENFGVILPSTSNKIEFAAGRSSDRLWTDIPYVNDKGYLNNTMTYAFSRSATQLRGMRNGAVTGTAVNVDSKPIPGIFTDNRLLVSPGNVSKVKLYAVRMTTKDLYGSDALKQNYRDDMAAFAKTDVVADVILQDYIKHGLVLNLRGDRGKSATLWTDQSEMGNNVVVYGTPAMEAKCYSLDGAGQYMKLTNALGGLQSYTVEFVVTPDAGGGKVLFHFSSQDKSVNFREFYAHFGSLLQIDAPFMNGRGENNEWMTEVGQFPYSSFSDRIYQYSVARTGNAIVDGVSVKQCGIKVDGPVVATQTPLNEMKFCYIGQDANSTNRFKGKIYGVRVYNRVLTEKECQINYLVDKRLYGLLN